MQFNTWLAAVLFFYMVACTTQKHQKKTQTATDSFGQIREHTRGRL